MITSPNRELAPNMSKTGETSKCIASNSLDCYYFEKWLSKSWSLPSVDFVVVPFLFARDDMRKCMT